MTASDNSSFDFFSFTAGTRPGNNATLRMLWIYSDGSSLLTDYPINSTVSLLITNQTNLTSATFTQITKTAAPEIGIDSIVTAIAESITQPPEPPTSSKGFWSWSSWF
jgi:hypothetical protein